MRNSLLRATRVVALLLSAMPLGGCWLFFLDDWDDDWDCVVEPQGIETTGAENVQGQADATHLYVTGNDFSGALAFVQKLDPADLSPDASFGVDGTVVRSAASAGGLALDGASLFIALTDGGGSWRVEKRATATGTLDGSFDGDGALVPDLSGASGRMTAIRVDATSLYLLGEDFIDGPARSRLEKRDKVTGALDAAFGMGGVIRSDGTFTLDAMAVDASAICVVGRVQNVADDWAWRIDRLNLSDGLRAAGFTLVASNPTVGFDAPLSIAVNATSMFVSGVEGRSLPDPKWRIEKRALADGSPDAAFGTAGAVTANPGPHPDEAEAVTISGGTFYVGGFQGEPTDRLLRVEKRDAATGAPVPGFPSGGIYVFNPGRELDGLRSLVVGAAKVFGIGRKHVSTTGGTLIRIEHASHIETLDP